MCASAVSISNKRSGSDFWTTSRRASGDVYSVTLFSSVPNVAIIGLTYEHQLRVKPVLDQIADSSFLTCLERGVQICSSDTLDFLCLVGIAWFCIYPSFACLPIKREVCFFVTALYVIRAQCLIFSSMYFLYIHFCRCCRSHETIFVDVFCTGSFRSLGSSISPVLSSVYYDMIIPVSDKMSLVG